MRDGAVLEVESKQKHVTFSVREKGDSTYTSHVRKIYSYKIQKPINYLQCYWGQILSCSFCVVWLRLYFWQAKRTKSCYRRKGISGVCLSLVFVYKDMQFYPLFSSDIVFPYPLLSFVRKRPKWATCGDGTFYNISVPLCWKFVLNNLSCWTSSFSILLLFYTLYFFWLVSAIWQQQQIRVKFMNSIKMDVTFK